MGSNDRMPSLRIGGDEVADAAEDTARSAGPHEDGASFPHAASARIGRRGFVGQALALSGGMLLAPRTGRAFTTEDASPPNVAPWSVEQGAGVLNPPYGLPSSFERAVVRKRLDTSAFPSVAGTPLQSLFGIITPSGLHYERHHAGVPAIDPDQHRLMIHGMVDRPLIMTMDDLTRFPSVSRLHFIECSGNTSQWKTINPAWTVQARQWEIPARRNTQ
jgi:sulfane dehydrogenase subunit SoxC